MQCKRARRGCCRLIAAPFAYYLLTVTSSPIRTLANCFHGRTESRHALEVFLRFCASMQAIFEAKAKPLELDCRYVCVYVQSVSQAGRPVSPVSQSSQSVLSQFRGSWV